jgi:hypothetical protein
MSSNAANLFRFSNIDFSGGGNLDGSPSTAAVPKDKELKRATTVNRKAKKSSELRALLTTEQLCDIWEKIRADTDARRALARLGEAGFRISHLKPMDATFKYPSWADYIAALPLLSDKPSTRRIYLKTRLRKYWPLVRELRRFADKWNAPFVEVKIFACKDHSRPGIRTLRKDLLKAASMLEHFLSWDYYVRYSNRRNAVIAELRWTIRERTGRPHDRELNVLIDAAFRAAGYKNACHIDSTTLDRIEKREKENREKVNRRVRSLIKAHSPSL